jgi:hypothetical protein
MDIVSLLYCQNPDDSSVVVLVVLPSCAVGYQSFITLSHLLIIAFRGMGAGFMNTGRINPGSYDTYLKAYSMAMLTRERDDLNYGGKSTSFSSCARVMLTVAF